MISRKDLLKRYCHVSSNETIEKEVEKIIDTLEAHFINPPSSSFSHLDKGCCSFPQPRFPYTIDFYRSSQKYDEEVVKEIMTKVNKELTDAGYIFSNKFSYNTKTDNYCIHYRFPKKNLDI